MYYNKIDNELRVGFGDKCRFCERYRDNSCEAMKCFFNLVSSTKELSFFISDCGEYAEQDVDNMTQECSVYFYRPVDVSCRATVPNEPTPEQVEVEDEIPY